MFSKKNMEQSINKRKKYLFIGGVFLAGQESYIKTNSISAVQNAANTLQWSYIKGIEGNTKQPIDILNGLFVGAFPKYFKKIIVNGIGCVDDDNSRRIMDASFINLPVISGVSKYASMKKMLEKWISDNEKDELYIIAYGFFEQNIKLISYAKKKNYNIVTCLIIPDLPQYMSLEKKNLFYKKLLYRRIYRIFYDNAALIDVFSVITEEMVKTLELNEKKYVVIDGMADDCNVDDYIVEGYTSSSFSFLYTGGLSKSYGVDKLLTSFLKLKNKQTQLWICGDGPLKNEVIKMSAEEPRIKYFGVLPHAECVSLQKKASCLVNPRDDSEITKYSFPSKTMEYMASGKPVIAKRLAGMSEEYSLYFFEFSSCQNLSETMDKVSLMDKEVLNERGEASARFVFSDKNSLFQTRKLLDVLDESCRNRT